MSLILTLNTGSSSIKFAAFAVDDVGEPVLSGQVDGLGESSGEVPRLTAKTRSGGSVRKLDPSSASDRRGAMQVVLDLLDAHTDGADVAAVGHRIVHGGADLDRPVVLGDAMLDRLAGLNNLAPLHQPHNLAGAHAAMAAFPDALQVGCFDTAFHRAHPFVADTYALPPAFYDAGIRRYGFHGLSYEYVSGQLAEIAPGIASGRVVISHLGNGASMCAVKNGVSVGSTMGFTALDGLPMGTRCGQLDPGVVLHMLTRMQMTADDVTDLLYRRSGLKGMSGLSQDMRDLEAAGTPEAARAIDYFVARVRREIGAMSAILSGIDALVFCGGIGENAVNIRQRICGGFEWLGVALDPQRNEAGATFISTDDSAVAVMVVPTNEELAIARHTRAMLAT